MKGCSRKPAGRFVTAALTALLLAGCVAQPPAPPPEEPAAAPVAEVAPASKSGPESETVTARLPEKEPEPAKPAIVVPDPEKLLGMSRAGIVEILGRPDFRRLDAPALLLRYRDARCILDLFLYPPKDAGKEGGPAVEHIEARKPDGSPTDTKGCIASVVKSRAAKTPS